MRLLKLFGSDQGIGMVTALSVSFVVFSLGAVTYSVSVHEIDEVTFDRNRTSSINVAEAGAREAMAMLAVNQGGFRDSADAGEATTGKTAGGECLLDDLETSIDGLPKVVGSYWVRATPVSGEVLTYLIEAWGWAPSPAARQGVAKKLMFQVTLIPLGGGDFTFAVFVGATGAVSAQQAHVYGDVYARGNISITNQTYLFVNDDGYPGDGSLLVGGDLSFSNKFEAAGTVTVNEDVTQTGGSNATVGDLEGLSDADLRKFHANNDIRVAGTLTSTSQTTAGGEILQGVTGLVPGPDIPLPVFDWANVTGGQTYPDWSTFETTYLNANSGSLSGYHYVQDASGNDTWDVKQSTFADDFLLVVDGALTLTGPADVAVGAAPVTVTVVGNTSSSTVATGNLFRSTTD
ncbi:MAG: hypothetical protein ACRDVM_08405, partial [Acidimicrobiia bacterium]